ncbi:MAG: rhodanese-like domain-containing protein [Gemmatimonadota bacterium]|nr:rhodanese-like domain-containing protein [Gemmatimonadota bacterium]
MRLVLLAAVGAGFLAGCDRGSRPEAERLRTVHEMIEEIRGDFPDVSTVSVGELMELMQTPDGVVLVDVRTEEERSVSTLPGALSPADFESAAHELGGRTVVAYCTIGVRSSRFAREMAALGLEVSNLEGSILAWTHEGGALVTGGRETSRVHVYGPSWALAADGYETVW